MCLEGEETPRNLVLKESLESLSKIGSMISRYLRTIYVQFVVKRELIAV
jgi:hypothetical protein